jgi:predicted  nucleic acid-binding Zn-ribbon protein
MVLVCRHCAHVFSEEELLLRSCPICMSNTRFLEYFVTDSEADEFKHAIIKAGIEKDHYPAA